MAACLLELRLCQVLHPLHILLADLLAAPRPPPLAGCTHVLPVCCTASSATFRYDLYASEATVKQDPSAPVATVRGNSYASMAHPFAQH